MTSIYHEVATAELRLNGATLDIKTARARAEQDIIDEMQPITGGDATERKAKFDRYLTLKLTEHKAYQAALKMHRALEERLALAKADLEVYKDARRQEEWSIRANLIAVLARRNLDTDPVDSAFDQAADDDGFDQGLYDGQNGIDPADEPSAYEDDQITDNWFDLEPHFRPEFDRNHR